MALCSILGIKFLPSREHLCIQPKSVIDRSCVPIALKIDNFAYLKKAFFFVSVFLRVSVWYISYR